MDRTSKIVTVLICFAYVSILTLLLNSTHAFASLQMPSQRSFSVDDGLSHIAVYDIEQDQDGYIWLATQRGIDRFDGYTFTTFGQNDDHTKGLPGAFVSDIELDKNTGDLWIATYSGLSVMDTFTATFETFVLFDDNMQVDNIVNTVYSGAAGDTWVGTQHGVYKRNNDSTFTLYSSALGNVAVSKIQALENGDIVVATDQGVLLLDMNTQQWRTLVTSSAAFTALKVDNLGNVWAGTNGQGLFHISGDSVFTKQLRINEIKGINTATQSVVNNIMQAQDGSIWVATTNGISIFSDPSEFNFVNHNSQTLFNSDSASDSQRAARHVLSVFEDKRGHIFYGTLTNGFSILDPNSILFSRLVVGNSSVIFAISIENENNIWVTGEQGVFNLDKNFAISGPLQHADPKFHNAGNISTSVHYSTITNTLWAGSRVGLSKLNPATSMLGVAAFDDFFVYTIDEDQNGDLWLGTRNNGLIKYDGLNNKVLAKWDFPLVFKTLVTSDNKVWVASIGGLYLIDQNTNDYQLFTADINNPTALPFDVVTWISAIGDDEYIIGTQSKGLAKMRFTDGDSQPVFEQLFTDSVISQLSIGAVVKGVDNNYWITTTEGIARANLAFDDIQYFGENDGASSSGYFIGSYAADNSGRIFVAGPKGLTYFHPDSIKYSASFPELHFTHASTLSKNDHELREVPLLKSLDQTKLFGPLVLTPNNLAFSIEFAALEYGNPKAIKYKYKLEGFHSEWQLNEANLRMVSFTNLDAGEYKLHVASTNRYDDWNKDSISMQIIVLAPWWQTKWAVTLFVLFALLTLYLIHRLRTYTLHKYAQRLASMVEAKTQDLGEANKKLSLLLNLDPLTNVYNRRGFTELASKEYSKFKRYNTEFSIVLLDVDRFKQVNDQYGHNVGDESLIIVANQLKSALRSHDILARWGGEEFIILLPSTDQAGALQMAKNLLKNIDETPFTINNITLNLTLSAGVAQITNADTIESCIKKADEFLYAAKDAGRNRAIG